MSIVVVFAAAAVAIGCGDDSSDESAGDLTTSSLTKADYLQQANKACVGIKARMFKSLGPKQSEGESISAVVVPATEAQIDQIRALGAPQDDGEEIETLLTATQQDLDAATKQDLDTPVEFFEQFGDSDKLARKYGLDSCAFYL
ncbi:MAG TPA: hypothetical protein VNP96_03630 [Solirubrobacterales bacterium]|nr:hypothetical protein [Solirubrobacterales bacterium]